MAALRELVKTPVGEGDEAASGHEAWQHVVEDRDLQPLGKRGPGQATDDGIEAFAWGQVAAEVELLCASLLEVQPGKALPQIANEDRIQLDPEKLARRGHDTMDHLGDGSRAGAEFQHAFGMRHVGCLAHAMSQCVGRGHDGSRFFPVTDELAGEGDG